MSKKDIGDLILVQTPDEFSVKARLFAPASRPRATLVVQGATGVPQRYYRAFARDMRDRGYRVLTFDYRGIGESQALGEHAATMADWGMLDTSAVHRLVEDSFIEPTIVVGHSFGGQALGLFEPPPRVAAIALVASQLGYVGYWPTHRAAYLSFMWRVVVPLLTSTAGKLPGWAGIGTALPTGVARQWARWCMDPEYLFGEFPEGRALLGRLRLPMLSYSFTDDSIAPRQAVEALHREFSSARLEHVEISPRDLGAREIGHFGFFRAHNATLWSHADQFFSDVLSGRPRIARPVPFVDDEITMSDVMADLNFGRAP